MRIWAWTLIGLGSVRLAAAASPRSKPIWFLNLFMHVFEMVFWWTEALEPSTLSKLFALQGESVDKREQLPFDKDQHHT